MPERFDLHARNIVYTCTDGAEMRTLLEIAELNIAQGTLVSVQGTSGAGKTTLLKVLSGIVRIDNARICWGKTDLTRLSENQRDEWRGTHCGFLFQDFGLFDGLTALENVLLPETFRGGISAEAKSRARELLEQFDVPAGTQALRLSRGEMQRTALARLLMGKPRVIFADEPTASLDEANARRVMKALVESALSLGSTLMVITHDTQTADRFPARARMQKGRWSWLSG